MSQRARKQCPTEHQEQAALIKWAELQAAKYPDLNCLFAVPNGGHRHIVTAGKLKAEGVKAGYPDLGLDVARREYHGLRIEMKRVNAKPSDVSEAQSIWHERLRAQGYFVSVCKGWLEARKVIAEYLGIELKEAA